MGQVSSVALPHNYPELRDELLSRYDGLPSQLKIIAQYLIDRPNEAAFMTIASLSDTTGVQPSAFIRFSKAIGFKGFSDIQLILRSNLSQRRETYAERVARSAQDSDTLPPLLRYTQLANMSINAVANDITEDQVKKAVDLFHNARLLHVVGPRRSWPVAAYFAYIAAGFGAETHLFSPAGAMVETNVSLIKKDDVMLAISFPEYSSATLSFVEQAKHQGVPIVAITNSRVAPVAREATVVFEVDQETTAGFRSAAGAMALAQILAVTYGEAADKG